MPPSPSVHSNSSSLVVLLGDGSSEGKDPIMCLPQILPYPPSLPSSVETNKSPFLTADRHTTHLPPSFSLIHPSPSPLLVPRFLSFPLVSLALFLQHHIAALRSGKVPSRPLRVLRPSLFVLLSCVIPFPLVALAFLRCGCLSMSLLISLISLSSSMADAIVPNSELWNKTDVALCTLGAFVGPVRALLLSRSLLLSLSILLVISLCLPFLHWSRSSATQAQFERRHATWHIVSATGLLWFAWAVAGPLEMK